MEPAHIAGRIPQQVIGLATSLLTTCDRVEAERDIRALLQAVHARGDTTPVTPQEAAQFIDLVARRQQQEPLAYLTGHTSFMGMQFAINRHVMVIRPKLESVVRVALRVAARLIALYGSQDVATADIGTGSGALAVALARYETRLARIYATDISPEALAVASQNCKMQHVEDRVLLLQGDLLQPLPEPVRLLIANLPFIAHDHREDLAPEVRASEPKIREYEPPLAIFGDEDGLGHHRRMLANAPRYLLPGAVLLMALHVSQEARFEQLVRNVFAQARLYFVAIDPNWSTLAVIQTP